MRKMFTWSETRALAVVQFVQNVSSIVWNTGWVRLLALHCSFQL